MRFSQASALLLAAGVAGPVLAASAHMKRDEHHNRHLHKREGAGSASTVEELAKRGDTFSGRATYYDVTPNPGACGDWMQNSEWVIALNTAQLQAYGGYQNGKPTTCYKQIWISGNGQTRTGTIKDECPSCGWGEIDLSPSLFTQFAPESDGIFTATWGFTDGSGGGGGDPQPTTTTQPAYTPPTTTWTPDPTTSTSTWSPPPSSSPPTTTSSSTSTHSSSGSSHSASADGVSIMDAPSSSPTSSATYNNVQNAPAAIVGIANFLQVAANLRH